MDLNQKEIRLLSKDDQISVYMSSMSCITSFLTGRKRRNNGGSVYKIGNPRRTWVYAGEIDASGSAGEIPSRVPEIQGGRFGKLPLPAQPPLRLNLGSVKDEMGSARRRFREHSSRSRAHPPVRYRGSSFRLSPWRTIAVGLSISPGWTIIITFITTLVGEDGGPSYPLVLHPLQHMVVRNHGGGRDGYNYARRLLRRFRQPPAGAVGPWPQIGMTPLSF